MFKPAKIEPRRGRIPVSEEARREARLGMGGEQTALAAGEPAPVPAPKAPQTPDAAAADASALGPPIPALRKPRVPKTQPTTTAADGFEQEHSVKLPKSVVQEIKLNLALMARAPGSPNNIKQYLEMAHRLLDAQLRKAGKLPPLSVYEGLRPQP